MRLRRGERGEGQIGCLFGLILLGIVAFIAYKVIPLKVKAAELQQEVTDDAKSAGMMNDDKIRASILNKAHEDDLPVTEDNVKISRANSEITIEVDYVVPIQFPGYTYQWHIEHYAHNPIF